MDCIEISTIKRDLTDDEEKNKPNLINYRTWQFRIRFIDVWGRDSEHGVISDMYVGTTGGSCIADSNGLPRCLKLKFKAGCPFVDKIEIEYRNCNGNTRGLSKETDWFLYDVINKWNDCDPVPWYERTVNNPYQREYDRLILLGLTPAEAAKKANSFLKYDPATNRFEYTFCNNKECTPVDVNETNRGFNPLPILSGSVFSIANNIALARNTEGYEPITCDELDKIQFTVTPPSPQGECPDKKLRKIKIWAVIWNPFEDLTVQIREDEGTPVFGVAHCTKNNPFTYKQVLPKGQEGFIGYLAGTKNYAISKQYRHDRVTGADDYVGFNYSIPGGVSNSPRYMPIHKFEFDVIPGKYVFRIAGHRSSPSDEYQKTSTYLIGQTPFGSPGVLIRHVNELVINVCTEDVEVRQEMMMIYDLTRIGKGCAVVESTNVVEGYIREDEINKIPIEMARVVPNNPINYRPYTDHNGHYFSASRAKGHYVSIYGVKNCTPNQYLEKSDTSYDNSDTWYRYNELYYYKGENK
jgi:hypothetical protein